MENEEFEDLDFIDYLNIDRCLCNSIENSKSSFVKDLYTKTLIKVRVLEGA